MVSRKVIFGSLFCLFTLGFFSSCEEEKPAIVLDPCECYDVIASKKEDHQIYDTCSQALHANDAFLKSYTKCQYAAITGRDTADVVIPEEKPATANMAKDGQYVVNVEESNVRFVGKKTILGKKHKGQFKLQEGTITIEDSTITAINLVVDINSLQETSNGLDEEMKAKFVSHLLGEDFFDAANHPTATFNFTTSNGATFKLSLEGELTIKGKTVAESMNASISGSGEDGFVAGGSFIINRTDFGVNYNSASIFSDLGDNIIEDEVPVAFTIKATRVAD